jgi:hypothetical protein
MNNFTRLLTGGMTLAAAGLFSTASHAVLMGTTAEGASFLLFDPAQPGTTPPATGSWFNVESSGYIPISSFQGMALEYFAQPAYGSHNGVPDGSESPSIDQPHSFLGNTGMWSSVSPITILSASGNTASLDFSGLRWSWNGLDNAYPVVESSLGDTGIATVVCAVNCNPGDSYVLDYTGHFALGTAFSGYSIQIHLEGVISTPVPAAAWLFGSGLLGLLGVAYRRHWPLAQSTNSPG